MKWKALILGGGGSLAEFQVGALRVISQKYKSFDMYIGIGAGSLNCSVLAQYDTLKEGYENVLAGWDRIQGTSDIFDVPLIGEKLAGLEAFTGLRDHIFGHQKLRETIHRLISWENLKDKKNWAIGLTSLNDGQFYTITNNRDLLAADENPARQIRFSMNPGDQFYIGNQFEQLVTAGGCVPFLLKPVDIFNHRFVEGGPRDCTPLELAVIAYEQARKDGFTEAEFVIVDNFTSDVSLLPESAVSNGNEILLRTISIFSNQTSKNGIILGKKRLAEIKSSISNVVVIQPTIEYPLPAMDFDDMELRAILRKHGVERATEILGNNIRGLLQNSEAGLFEIENIILCPSLGFEKALSVEKVQKILTGFDNEPYNLELSNCIVQIALTQPELMENAITNKYGLTIGKKSIDEILPQPKAVPPVETPADFAELKELLKTKKYPKSIKSVGALYAFDNIIQTDGIQVSLSKMNFIQEPGYLINPGDKDNLIEFGAGVTIEELNCHLDNINKALINQPGYEMLTFVGVASVGGHGSGIKLGPLADSIVSINLLVYENNDVVEKRVEKKPGVTDCNAYNAKYPDIKVIKDDEIFNAVKVSMGTMGVIRSVIVNIQPKFFLQEKRKLINWEILKKELPGKLRSGDIHSIHIWFNPYYYFGYWCVLTEYIRTDGPAKGRRGIGITSDPTVLVKVLLAITKHKPEGLRALLTSSLLSTLSFDREVILPSYEALNFGKPNLSDVEATNCGISADDATDYKDVIDAADRLLELVDSLSDIDRYTNCPFGFRFAAKSDALLAPQYGRDSCMIELPVIRKTPGIDDTLRDFLLLLTDSNTFKGRPHWGQRLCKIVDPDKLVEMYGQTNVDTFEKVKREFNDGTYDNAFTTDVGL